MRIVILAALFTGFACLARAQVNQGSVTALFDVRIPMRDAVELSADLWRPAAAGRYPAILLRTPYTKGVPFIDAPKLGAYFAGRGYVVLVQDVRGRGDSDGVFGELPQEGVDGYDSIEWIARQPWSDGRIGMMGVSYLGVVQWLAARERPPHLVCIVPTAAPGFPFEDEPYRGGAFEAGMLQWAHGIFGRSQQRNDSELRWDWILKQRPLNTQDGLAGGPRLPWFHAWIDHPTLDDYWRQVYLQPEDFRRMTIPTLSVGGWFDDTLPGVLYSWRGMANASPAADQQYLLIGPWNHIQTFVGGKKSIAGFALGEDSIIDIRGATLAFFERFLKGNASVPAPPRVQVYVTGQNQWHRLSDYPPAPSGYRHLYLHSQGTANTVSGTGTLDWQVPGREPADVYRYDPDDPAPSYSADDESEGSPAEPHRDREKRHDVLMYTTSPLAAPVTVLGPAHVVLYASSDARDTDFIVRILDVFPDGHAVQPYAGDGAIRARYRKGFDRIVPLTPNRIERYTIYVGDLGHRFLAGHRIRLELTSSSFPNFSPNTNTGSPIATDVEVRPAAQRVLHNRSHASYVELSILPDGL